MSEDQEALPTATFTVIMPDVAELPLLHVNALNLRSGLDEFFFTLGVVLPPEITHLTEEQRRSYQLTAQPVFRFAISRETMAKFLKLMTDQFEQQTATIQRLMQQMEGLQ